MALEKTFECLAEELERLFPKIGRGRFHRARFSALCPADEAAQWEAYETLKDEGIRVIGWDDPPYLTLLRQHMP